MYISNEARIIRESSHGYDLIPIQDEMLSHREVELVGEVDAASVNALVRQLRYLHKCWVYRHMPLLAYFLCFQCGKNQNFFS